MNMRSVDHPVTADDSTTRTVNLRVREDICDLIDKTLVRVDAETYAHFLNLLDQPPSG
jgi:uncharacterized protein (DUF1778 family)